MDFQCWENGWELGNVPTVKNKTAFAIPDAMIGCSKEGSGQPFITKRPAIGRNPNSTSTLDRQQPNFSHRYRRHYARHHWRALVEKRGPNAIAGNALLFSDFLE